MKSIAAYILGIVWEGIPLYQMYLYKKGFGTKSWDNTSHENSCCGSSFGKY
jgi:hypothetical protein